MNATLATAIAGNGAGRAKAAAGTEFEELFERVADLIRRVADAENPEILRSRAKVHFALVAAKDAFEDGAIHLPPQAARADEAHAAEAQFADFTDGYPGPSLGVALLVGFGLGLIVSLRQ